MGAAVYNGTQTTGYNLVAANTFPTGYGRGWFALVDNSKLSNAALQYPQAGGLGGRTQFNTPVRIGMRRGVLPTSST